MNWNYFLRTRLPEDIAKWLAWKLPELVVYWCYLRVAAHATSGKWASTPVPELKMMDALDRWGKDNHLVREYDTVEVEK